MIRPFLLSLAVLATAASAFPIYAQQAGVVTVLHQFTGADGNDPSPSLIQGANGLLYGVTAGGGAYGLGTVYRLSQSGVFKKLHDFGGADGSTPNDGLVQGVDGNLYGTTASGGTGNYGTVFRVTPKGGFESLYSFNGAFGNAPGHLVQGKDGNFYGAAMTIGNSKTVDSIFRLTPDGGYSTPLNFQPLQPAVLAGPLLAGGPNIYGLIQEGVGSGPIKLFSLSTKNFTFAEIHTFNNPELINARLAFKAGSELFYGASSTISGAAVGRIFSFNPKGRIGQVFRFDGNPAELSPLGTLVKGMDGSIYGIGDLDVINNVGDNAIYYLYQLTPDKAVTVLASILPAKSLLQGSDGDLYYAAAGPTRRNDPTSSFGAVYKVDLQVPLVSVIALTYFTLKEGGEPGRIAIVRTGLNLSAALTVNIAKSGDEGNALTLANGHPFPSQVVIPQGAAQVELDIKVKEDSVAEPNRTVEIELVPSSTGAYRISESATVSSYVQDDD